MGDVHLRLTDSHGGPGGGARRPAGVGLADRFVDSLLGSDFLLSQAHEAVGFARGDVGDCTGFVRSCSRRGRLPLGQRETGREILVPQLEQELPGFDAVAFVNGQARDLTTSRGRHARPLTCFDGSGPRVRDGAFDGASPHHRDADRERFALRCVPKPPAEGRDDEHAGRSLGCPSLHRPSRIPAPTCRSIAKTALPSMRSALRRISASFA